MIDTKTMGFCFYFKQTTEETVMSVAAEVAVGNSSVGAALGTFRP